MTATDKTEVVSDIVEEVVDISQSVGGRGMGFAFGAFLLGAGIGGGLAYLYANRRLTTKYSEIAAEEIAEMREHYQAKARALESEAAKRPVEEIVKERGYSTPDDTSAESPMAVQPPVAVVDDAADKLADDSAMAENDVEGSKGVKTLQEHRNVFRDNREIPVEREWNWDEERKRRRRHIPYVIHQDEQDAVEGYSVVSLTYYTKDDVLCNDREEIIDPADRDLQVGESNLELFGHGSGDPSIVFVRNDQLEIVYEIVKSPNSYAEEVHGFSHGAYDRGNLERMRKRERDAREE